MNLQEPSGKRSKRVQEPNRDVRHALRHSRQGLQPRSGNESDSSASSAGSADSTCSSASSQASFTGSDRNRKSTSSASSSNPVEGRLSLSSIQSKCSDGTPTTTPRSEDAGEARIKGKWTNKKRRTIFDKAKLGARDSNTTKKTRKLTKGKSRWLSPLEDPLELEFLDILDKLEEQEEFESMSELGESDSASDFLNDSDEEGELQAAEDDVSEVSDADWNALCSESRPLEDWELVAAAFDLHQRRLPEQDVAARIIRDVSNLYASSSTVVRLERPGLGERFIIVGDLHGHFGDLMHIIDEYGEPEPGVLSYLFNGDFVDRGSWGPEVLLLVYCWKLQFPTAVHLNRGNHEDEHQNRKPENGFCHQHCVRAWNTQGEPMYQLCRRSFKQLPLVHILGDQIAVMHGGLPLDKGVTLQEIDEIDRKHRVPVFSCNILGYSKNQRVKAKRNLTGLSGEPIAKGTVGRILWRVGKTSQARVRFCDATDHVEAEVTVAGAPEIEQNVVPVYDTAEQGKKKRMQRIFVSLLWSDPCPAGKNGPSRRGVGYQFDDRVTQEFLDVNGLSCILRSHQKRPEGFCEEHWHPKRGILASTVFSASNYPSGAGEPAGNKAAVLSIHGVAEGAKLMLPAADQVRAWRMPYASGLLSADPRRRGSVHMQLQQAEYSRGGIGMTAEMSKVESARVRVLQKLRCMIYSARPALLNYWNRVDEPGSGYVPLTEWASAMRACVVPDQDFPWEWLAQHLTFADAMGRCQYATFLGRYENTLVRRLARRWHGGALVQLAPGVTTKEAAIQKWDEIDRNGDGKLSYTELRPLLKSQTPQRRSKRNTVLFDSTVDDDRVYSILASLDADRSGFVEREEFVNAIVKANQREQSLIEGAEAFMELGHCRGRISSRYSYHARNSSIARNSLTDVFGKATEMVITQCWAALQGALRMLSAARASAETVFKVLDQDSDGQIDRAEFRDGLTRILQDSALLKTLDDWEPLLWKLVDEDGSGSVSPDELAQLLRVRDIVSL